MIIKLVNPSNKNEVCVYGIVKSFRISTKGSTPLNVDKFIEEHKNATDIFINEKSRRTIIRIYFELYNTEGSYEVFTNWKIYLMGDDGKTIESL